MLRTTAAFNVSPSAFARVQRTTTTHRIYVPYSEYNKRTYTPHYTHTYRLPPPLFAPLPFRPFLPLSRARFFFLFPLLLLFILSHSLVFARPPRKISTDTGRPEPSTGKRERALVNRSIYTRTSPHNISNTLVCINYLLYSLSLFLQPSLPTYRFPYRPPARFRKRRSYYNHSRPLRAQRRAVYNRPASPSSPTWTISSCI